MPFTVASLFRKKHPEAEEQSKLKAVLSAWDLSRLGIRAMICTGIFVLTGIDAAAQAGPAVVLSFMVSGVAFAHAGLAYADLSASFGWCGSAYGYSYAAFGEMIAWISSWD